MGFACKHFIFCPPLLSSHSNFLNKLMWKFLLCRLNSYLTHGSTYPIHFKVPGLLSKKGFDTHTDPRFKNLTILKLEDIYSLHLGNLCILSIVTQFLPVFPDPFYVLIKFMVITRVVQIDFMFLYAVP